MEIVIRIMIRRSTEGDNGKCDLSRVVHGEGPDKALVDQVNAIGEASELRVYEECPLLCVTEGSGRGTRHCWRDLGG